MASKKKPRNKRFTPRDPLTIKLRLLPWRVAAVFNPIEAILLQLETEGTITTSDKDMAMFKDTGDGIWYASADALEGMIEAFDIHRLRAERDYSLDALRRMAVKVRDLAPVFQEDIDAARECLVVLRAEALEMTAGYANNLIQDFKKNDEIITLMAKNSTQTVEI